MEPGFSPLAEALDLGASGYSPWIVAGAVRLGMAGPFVPAATLLTHFTGVAMHPSTLRRLTVAAGATMRQLELAFVDTIPVGGGEAATAPMQVSMDGSMVPLVEGWREVKLVAIGERAEAGALTALSYAATLGTVEAFEEEAEGELARRGIPGARDVVTVNDGAEWIQRVVDLHCPRAVRVLDFAHAAEYLAHAAREAFGEGTEAAQTWFMTQRHTLRHADPETVLTALRALPAGVQRDDACRYLAARRAQIAYRTFVDRGWPIGSGCVESAHKGIVQERLKRRGMRWSRPVAEGMLALRIVDANDRWEGTWDQVASQQRAAHDADTAARRIDRRRKPPREKLVQHGKPTDDHPWRNFRLPGSAPRVHPRI